MSGARTRRSTRFSTIPYRVTAILVRRDGRWLVHTYSGAEPQRSQPDGR